MNRPVAAQNEALVQDARQLIRASRRGLDDRQHVERTIQAVEQSRERLARLGQYPFDDLLPRSNGHPLAGRADLDLPVKQPRADHRTGGRCLDDRIGGHRANGHGASGDSHRDSHRESRREDLLTRSEIEVTDVPRRREPQPAARHAQRPNPGARLNVARRITAALKRGGIDCELLLAGRDPKKLN
jgi:hypothetical protein